jgi:hypothetical protein
MSSPQLPTPDALLSAIEIYLARAYPGQIPAAVRNRVQQIRDAGPDWQTSPAIERKTIDGSLHLAIRLGNPFYPHMKLAIDTRPTDDSFVFRVDTHDSHISPSPQSGEYEAFAALVRRNQQLASTIETQWESAALPTLKGCLKQELARRTEIHQTDHLQTTIVGGA